MLAPGRRRARSRSRRACQRVLPETLTAIFRPDDEETHETEFAVVGGDGTAADQFVAPGRRDEGLGVRGPEQLGIVKAGIPTLTRRPVDELVHLGTGHVADQNLSGHREAGIGCNLHITHSGPGPERVARAQTVSNFQV